MSGKTRTYDTPVRDKTASIILAMLAEGVKPSRSAVAAALGERKGQSMPYYRQAMLDLGFEQVIAEGGRVAGYAGGPVVPVTRLGRLSARDDLREAGLA
jgi:hypothetical protein